VAVELVEATEAALVEVKELVVEPMVAYEEELVVV
jgi:hypothetical protein